MKKEDLRVTKTKKNLYQGLLTLMKEKTFEEIKVTDICNEALTNRSTFYDHFNDKYELLNSLITDLETSLMEKLNENDVNNNPKEYYLKIIELFFDHVSEHIEAYSSILKRNNNSIVMDMINNVIMKDVTKNIIQKNLAQEADIPAEIVSIFYVSAVSNVCIEYIKYPTKYEKEDIINYLTTLIPNKIYQ